MVCAFFDDKMAHNVLVVGPNDRVFTFPVAKEVQTATLKEWLNQKLVCYILHALYTSVVDLCIM